MKILNTDMDNISLSGQLEPLDTYITKTTSKYKGRMGHLVNLGEQVDSAIPSKFFISSQSIDVEGIYGMSFTRSSFTLKDGLTIPLVWDNKSRMGGSKNLLLTGDTWSVMSGSPCVEAISLSSNFDIYQVRVLSAGVVKIQNGNEIGEHLNVLLEVPSDAFYLLDGEYYSCSSDSQVKHDDTRFVVTIESLLKQSMVNQ